MTRPIAESFDLAEATTKVSQGKGLLEVELITPGWGSSGYYSKAVLEAAAPLFKAGLHMYLDHPTAAEAEERPGRSVRDLAGVLKEDARVDQATGALITKIKPRADYRDFLLDEDFVKNIGLSIRGNATGISEGEAEGKTGPIIEGLESIGSVDFVTRAGRGGRVLQVLEAAIPSQVTARAIAHGVEEATADERRTQLSDAVRTQYGSAGSYAWVQDFDDTTVWFQASAENERGRYWQQSYEVAANDLAVTLTGERQEVRQVTRYLPINTTTTTAETADAPAPRPGSTTATSEEDTSMAKIEIEESEHTRLVTESGRVETLVQENAELQSKLTKLEESQAEAARRTKAGEIIAEQAREGKVTFDPLQTAGLMASLPVKEGALDETAFTTTVQEHIAKLQEAAGAGRISGYGSVVVLNDDTDPTQLREESDKARAGAFGRKLQEA